MRRLPTPCTEVTAELSSGPSELPHLTGPEGRQRPGAANARTAGDPSDPSLAGEESRLLTVSPTPAGAQDTGGGWWTAQVAERLLPSRRVRPVTLDNLILSALLYSPKVRAISDMPLIRELEICEAEARFDVTAFWDGKFDDISDPVGNVLTTGGPPRLREDIWDGAAGLRKRTTYGGDLELAQKIGYHTSNSTFFLPEEQGNARLTFSFTQPLLNGAGKTYNCGRVVLAQIDSEMAWDQLALQLRDHLLEVVMAYWQLYAERAIFVQRQRHLDRARKILEHLEARRSVDALDSQVLKAQAAVATRKMELLRARTAIRNAESRIRALVNDPELKAVRDGELVPMQAPQVMLIDIPLGDALCTALHHRPELDEAARRVRAAQVRLDLSTHELKPVLNVVAEAYVAGLAGSADIGQAFANQFGEGEPGYTLGLVAEIPLGNRAARARFWRRQLEVRRLANELESTVEMLTAEVEIAVREVTATAREVESAQAALRATQGDVAYIDERWRMLPGDDQAASFLLQDLLDAQDRMADAERVLVTAQVGYTLAHCTLQRAMGTLLDCEQISVHRVEDCGSPRLIFSKASQTPGIGPETAARATNRQMQR
jgi:outer membrane protein TolC